MYLTPEELVERYRGRVPLRRLQRWRYARCGPVFIRLGGDVLYDIVDVVAWESCNRISTDGKAPRTIADTQKADQANS